MSTQTPTTDIHQNENIITVENQETQEEGKNPEEENSLGEDISRIVQGRYHVAKNMRQTSGE